MKKDIKTLANDGLLSSAELDKLSSAKKFDLDNGTNSYNAVCSDIEDVHNESILSVVFSYGFVLVVGFFLIKYLIFYTSIKS